MTNPFHIMTHLCYKRPLSPVFIFLSLLLNFDVAAQEPAGSAVGAAIQASPPIQIPVHRAHTAHQELPTIPREKIFVHTDRSFYITGDICWCRLYCVDAASHTPIDLSKLAYLELLDRDNKSVLQAKVLLDKGEGHASFFLPATLHSGYYELRAYTNWMKNEGPAAFFEKTITVVNTFKNLAPPTITNHSDPDHPNSNYPDSNHPNPDQPGIPKPAASYHIKFFPEGGHLITGLRSKLAFELTDPNGKGAEGQGWILNEKNDTLASLTPLRYGLGHFFFTPLAGHTYIAAIRLPEGTTLRQPLPTPLTEGYICRFNDQDQQRLSIIIYASHGVSGLQTSTASPANNIYLAIQKGTQPASQTLTALIMGDSASFDIDKKDLGEGISRFTLLDAGRHPICERLFCIPPTRQLQIAAATDRQQYGIREKIRLSISSNNKKGDTVASDLSIAVYRLDSLQPDPREEMDIFTWLWLGSELKGNIEMPGSYFYEDLPHAAEVLDDLVLTHARIKPADSWSFPPECSGHIISGRVTDRVTGAPAKGVFAFLSAPGTQFQFAGSLTDTAGKFIFDLKDFYGTEGILVYTDTRDSSNYKIEIFNPFSELYDTDSLPPFYLDPALSHALAEVNLNMQVRNIYTPDSLKKITAPSRDSFRFYGPPDHTYLLDDYVRFSTMEEVLREYVDQINVDKWQGRLHLSMLNEPVHRFFEDNNNTLVLLDGIPVPDDKIFSYDPLKIKKLEIIPHQYILGPITFSGIASFTTYNGNYEGLELDSRSLQIDYDGLQLQQQFYSPAYNMDQQTFSHLPDFRDLLWWNDRIHTNTQTKNGYEFYSSDLPGKYLIVIQGLTADGMTGARYLPFEVK